MESQADTTSLVQRFVLDRLLNQDQNDRRISLLGSIDHQPAILLAERAAFPVDQTSLVSFCASLTHISHISANDIYHWALACSPSSPDTPDVKLTLIYPSTPQHVAKYSVQPVRMVTETPAIYQEHVRPYMSGKREAGRLNWVYNIIEGRKEQEDVLYRHQDEEEGFLLLPDLNWDRKTMGTLRLLTLVQRRDIWSLRDLKKKHVPWLKHMKERILDSVVKVYPSMERDQVKLYVHYQPTYYHFHIHVVNVMLDAGSTQATGKAFGLENLISQLETIAGNEEAGMADVDLTYYLGEASELWVNVFAPLKSK
ncbi:putative 5'-(N(7)-methyl 5'-triphosphoguanosine)-[mRNA] diphosphatase [Microsporum audouinii]